MHLRSTKDGSPCQTKEWMHSLGRAVTRNFDCSYYFSSHLGTKVGSKEGAICDFTFYGIATNASMAGFAFAAAFNRIAVLSAAHLVPPEEYEHKRRRGVITCGKSAYTTAARASYCDGLARGLYEAVQAAKATAELQQQRKLEMARSKASRGEAWQESDNDDDDDDDGEGGISDDRAVGGGGGGGGDDGGGDGGDDGGDNGGGSGDGSGGLDVGEGCSGSAPQPQPGMLDGATSGIGSSVASGTEEAGSSSARGNEGASSSNSGDVKPPPVHIPLETNSHIPLETNSDDVKPPVHTTAASAVAKLEQQQKAATALVAHKEKVAEAFLKEAGVKLSKGGHKYTRSTWRQESYVQGKADSKTIDINQRSLAGPTSSA